MVISLLVLAEVKGLSLEDLTLKTLNSLLLLDLLHCKDRVLTQIRLMGALILDAQTHETLEAKTVGAYSWEQEEEEGAEAEKEGRERAGLIEREEVDIIMVGLMMLNTSSTVLNYWWVGGRKKERNFFWRGFAYSFVDSMRVDIIWVWLMQVASERNSRGHWGGLPQIPMDIRFRGGSEVGGIIGRWESICSSSIDWRKTQYLYIAIFVGSFW